MKRVRCYDNQGKTVDRYTIITITCPHMTIFTSAHPTHPLGVWSADETPKPIDRHNHDLGKRVSFYSLPDSVKSYVKKYLNRI